jgi:hypothetical protein
MIAGAYLLNLHSPSTNKSYTIDLGDDVSGFPKRFNKFIVGLSEYEEIEAGTYHFEAIASDGQPDNTQWSVAEKGLLLVRNIPQAEDEIVTLEQEETDDDIVVIQ